MNRYILYDLTVVCLLLISLAGAQQVNAPVTNGGVYVIGFRTPGHVMSSSPTVFHTAMSDIRKLLEANSVTLVADAERGFIENESQMSIESMTKLAQEAGATTLLQVTVDRPATKWIKVTLRSYDLTGKLLWEEKVDSGSSAMSGSSGYKKCFEKLAKVLKPRVGGPGLPSVTASEAPKTEKTS